MTWRGFSYCWTFVRGIYRSPVVPLLTGPVIRRFGVSLVARLKQSNCRWFETPWRSYDIIAIDVLCSIQSNCRWLETPWRSYDIIAIDVLWSLTQMYWQVKLLHKPTKTLLAESGTIPDLDMAKRPLFASRFALFYFLFAVPSKVLSSPTSMLNFTVHNFSSSFEWGIQMRINSLNIIGTWPSRAFEKYHDVTVSNTMASKPFIMTSSNISALLAFSVGNSPITGEFLT